MVFLTSVRLKSVRLYTLRSAMKSSSKLDSLVEDAVKKRAKQSKKMSYIPDHVHDAYFGKLLLSTINAVKSENEALKAILKRENISFTKVQVAPGRSHAQIFWNSTKVQDIEALQRLNKELQETCSQELKSEVIRSKALGSDIPAIIFKEEPVMTSSEKMDQLFRQIPNEDLQGHQLPPPVLKTDVMGFDRDKALTKILEAIHRAKAPHRNP